eukprot:XP_001709905.1 Kinase, NEK [Giardia lamblia ATCC 50803]
MHTASSGSATVALSVPPFTPRELHEGLDDVLAKDPTSTLYSLRDFPDLAVKEILLDGLDKGDLDAIKTRLTALLDLSHPGVLRHYQVVEDDDFIYIVTDHHDSTLERPLAKHKRGRIPVPITMILSVMKQVAAALAYLHGLSGANTRGLVHCDLRPASTLVSVDGEYFIIAGLELCKDALWSESTIAGMAAYMAPEVLLHNEPSPASDVWSLGVIVYEMATLRKPDFLKGKEPAEVFVDEWRPDLSGVTDGFIQNVLERIFVLEPERRPTASELHETLTAADIPVGELGGQCVMLKYKCGSLEAALNGANARIALLEEDVKTKSTKIDALEDQSKEHLAMIKALENRLAQFGDRMNTAGPQSSLFLLPRLMRAAHTNGMETVRMLLEEDLVLVSATSRGASVPSSCLLGRRGASRTRTAGLHSCTPHTATTLM